MRREAERLQDILDAIATIERYTSQGRQAFWGKGSETATKCHVMAETQTGTGVQKKFCVLKISCRINNEKSLKPLPNKGFKSYFAPDVSFAISGPISLDISSAMAIMW